MNRVTIMWRRALMRGLIAALAPRPGGGVPNWGARQHRVLFMRHQRIGDLLMATGTIRAIANSHPTVQVDVLASSASATILDGNSHVRRVLRFDRRRWWTWPRLLLELRRARYDAIIDGQVNHTRPFPTEIALMAAAGVAVRIGADLGPGNTIYTMPVTVARDAHFVEQTAATAIPFGVDPTAVDLHPYIQLTSSERDRAELMWMAAAPETRETHAPRVLVNVSVAEPWRRWPEDRFVAAVRHLRGYPSRPVVLVIGAPSDTAQAARIAAASGVSPLTPSLRDAMAIVAAADLVLTPNTALSHVASAVGVPVVEMLPRSHAAFTAYRTVGRSLMARDNNLMSIPVEQVIKALDGVLQDVPAKSDRGRRGGLEHSQAS